MTEEIVEEPSDTVPVAIVANMEAPAPVVHDHTLQRARIGDAFHVSADRPVPEGWEVSDGQLRHARDYREFAAALGIQGATFRLPILPHRPGIQTIVRIR